MKESVIRSVTAIICVAVLCITSCVSVNNYSDAVKEAAKLAGTVSAIEDSVADESTDTSVNDNTDISADEVTDITTDETINNVTEEEEVTQADTTEVTDGTAKPETTEKSDSPMTVEEIVNLFNKSANKIKTDAVKVVKNYEKRKVNEDKFVLPDGLENTAKDLIKKYMGDDTEPIAYSTKEDIRNEYIVPDQDYVSKLQPSTVAKATCVDKGSTYEIYLKLKDQKNPRAGNGVGAVCDVIEVHEVSEKVSFIERFDTLYFNCEVRATIEKATGRMIHTNYCTPVVLDLTVNLFGKHNAAVSFTFEKDYSITY